MPVTYYFGYHNNERYRYVRIFLEKILAVDSITSYIIVNGYRRIMYKKVSLTIIMASAIAAILHPPHSAVGNAAALARAVGFRHHPEDPQRRTRCPFNSAAQVERQPSRRGPYLGRASRDDRQVRA